MRLLVLLALLSLALPAQAEMPTPVAVANSSLLVNSTCSDDNAAELIADDLPFDQKLRLTEISAAFEGMRKHYGIDTIVGFTFSVVPCTKFGRPFEPVVLASPPTCDPDACKTISSMGTYKVRVAKRVVAADADLGPWATAHAACFIRRSLERSYGPEGHNPSFERIEGCVSELLGLAVHAQLYLKYLTPALQDPALQAEQLNEYMALIASVVDEKRPRW